MAKSWSIIGVGPVGSMQAALIATVFPGQQSAGSIFASKVEQAVYNVVEAGYRI